MRRREFTLISMSALVAGCTGDRQEETSTSNASNGNTPSEASTESSTEGTKAKTQTQQQAPSIRLQVLFRSDLNATLSLERLSDKEIVFEETEEYADGENVNLTGEFEANTDYRFSISNAEDEIIWDRNVYDYEGFVLEVISQTEVEVASHTEY